MTREELIEKAAKAMVEYDDPGVYGRGDVIANWDDYVGAARAALAVFEQAHTPSDDERELRTLRNVAKDYDTNFPCDGGCNANDGPEETCSRHGRSPRDLWNLLDAARRTVQGEPSDAAVRLSRINDLLGSLDLNGGITAEGTAWGSILREALALSAAEAERGER